MTVFLNCVNVEKSFTFNDEEIKKEVTELLRLFFNSVKVKETINESIKNLKEKYYKNKELISLLSYLEFIDAMNWNCSAFIK